MKTVIAFITGIFMMSYYLMPETLTLKEAMAKNLVSAKVTALGGFQGEVAEIEIANKSSRPFFIEVEPGRIFNSDKTEFQNLINVKKQTILVNSKDKERRKIIGFCCESTDKCPKISNTYKTSHYKDTSLILLANYISNFYESISKSSIQQAVWAISNKHESAAIGVSNEKEQSLKYLVCTIKNEPIPWYVIKQKIYTLPNGNIHLVNDSLSGKISYSISKWTYSYINLYDNENNEVLISIGTWLKPGAKNELPVDLAISKLRRGNYELRLENESEIVTHKTIQI
ncbi:MAG: hypothetical protein AB7O73_12505 [Bacteroidia bacterium]